MEHRVPSGLPPLLERVWSLADILVDGDGYSAELEGAMHRASGDGGYRGLK
ncbi:MAG: hypothetical protein ACLSWY_10445 [Ruthenibacterium lactatiformans]